MADSGKNLSKDVKFVGKNRHFGVKMICFWIPETEMKIIITISYLWKLQTLSAVENIVLLNQNGQKMLHFWQKRPYFSSK